MDGTRLTRRQQKGGATSEGEGQVVVGLIEIRAGLIEIRVGLIEIRAGLIEIRAGVLLRVWLGSL